ncbi:hypothetical protein IAQ61_009695, partial [Plenodomus lingam]
NHTSSLISCKLLDFLQPARILITNKPPIRQQSHNIQHNGHLGADAEPHACSFLRPPDRNGKARLPVSHAPSTYASGRKMDEPSLTSVIHCRRHGWTGPVPRTAMKRARSFSSEDRFSSSRSPGTAVMRCYTRLSSIAFRVCGGPPGLWIPARSSRMSRFFVHPSALGSKTNPHPFGKFLPHAFKTIPYHTQPRSAAAQLETKRTGNATMIRHAQNPGSRFVTKLIKIPAPSSQHSGTQSRSSFTCSSNPMLALTSSSPKPIPLPQPKPTPTHIPTTPRSPCPRVTSPGSPAEGVVVR